MSSRQGEDSQPEYTKNRSVEDWIIEATPPFFLQEDSAYRARNKHSKTPSRNRKVEREKDREGSQPSHQTHGAPARPLADVERLSCNWEMQHVVEEMQRAPGGDETRAFDLLSSFVIITGSPRGLECATCGSYLVKRWPRVGLPVLATLCKGIEDLQLLSGKRVQISCPVLGSMVIARDSVMLVDRKSDDRDAVEAPTWLCTAIRQTPILGEEEGMSKPIHLSSVVHHSSKKGHDLRLLLENFSPHELRGLFPPDSTCWLQLFKSVIIAWNQDVDDTSTGDVLPGLEIPFDMMVHLAAAENYHHVDGGIILLGFFTTLIPVRRNPDSNTIHWHFECSNNGDMIRPFELDTIQRDWYKTTDVSELANSKCVLGWFEHANIMLGTSSLVGTHKLTWTTGIPSRRRTAHREGFEEAARSVSAWARSTLRLKP
ncbi:hypothetical protein PG991_008915 [Apiospora marii]|uniref:Uncharacterized protein n=1 Tax=Apiospora marii TaxID=335849 RepID=A0ABR1RMK5_9PEZI